MTVLSLPHIVTKPHDMPTYTYWNRRGRLQWMANALNALVPPSGSVPNKSRNRNLETFRIASNAYYDLYNNGLWNRARSFSRVFGMRVNDYMIRYKGGFSEPCNHMFHETEKRMDAIIYAAAKEQGII
jgi:hypothetical protein